MPHRSISILTLMVAVFLTAGLSWFAIRNYSTAAPVANDSLRGLALTIASAMEGVASRDPSLKSLASFQTQEVAYAMLISRTGTILLHSNPDLTGTTVDDIRYQHVLTTGTLGEERVQLGTGEQVYEFQAPFHLPAETCVLRLALHTWRYEAVMRRARFGLTLIFSLLTLGWGLGITVFWLLRRQEAQDKLLSRQQELVRLGELGAVMAHEIRNPLAGIKGYAQLTETAVDLGQAHSYAGKIVTQSLRMESLVDDLLSFAREDKGERYPADLAALVLDSVMLTRIEADMIKVTVIHAPHEAMNVVVASDRIFQMLLNLQKNALQAMPDGGELRVTLEGRASTASLRISDTGIGIPEENLPHIFDPFWTSKARGTGLGLALCRKVAQEHGGTLTVESAVGKGTTFTVTLPLAK